MQQCSWFSFHPSSIDLRHLPKFPAQCYSGNDKDSDQHEHVGACDDLDATNPTRKDKWSFDGLTDKAGNQSDYAQNGDHGDGDKSSDGEAWKTVGVQYL